MIGTPKLHFLTLIAVIIMLNGCSPTATSVASVPASAPATSEASLPIIATIDLGVVVQGESAKLSSWIKNQSKNSVAVSKIESSCECLGVRLSKTRIASGERVLAHIHYEGAKEPEFVGSLQIEVHLIGDGGTMVGQINVPVEVIPANDTRKAEP